MADTDHKGLQCDPSFLEQTGGRARVFIAGFDPIGDKNDDVPAIVALRKIRGRSEK
ncbi:MAG: Uncharacterised protein [Flavobacteriia bacterium]|nr:MAG: Uncharacterised protein [Flavobacteriia bacterium]